MVVPEAKKQGAITVAITSINHTTNVTCRHSNSLNLYQVCDYVLDNGGIVGDAAVILDGLPQKIAPTTSVIDISFNIQSKALSSRMIQYK